MKADLNLLPKKKSNISTKSVAIISILGIIVLGLVGYFLVYVPNAEKNRISKEIEEKQEELDKYKGLDEELTQLNAEISELNKIISMVDGISSEYVEMTEKLKNIVDAIPVEVFLKNISYSADTIQMDGEGPDYTDIARFMVNLRNIKDVDKVSLSSVNHFQEEDEDDNEITKYTFNLTINYGDIIEEEIDEAEDVEEVEADEEGDE